jgi:hypothetical protein
MEALKIAAHILCQVPSKSVHKTPYEIWTGRKPNMNYLHVWGCPTEAKLFNPHIVKQDPKIVSYHFIDYPFCCPDHTTKLTETRHTIFLEHDALSGSSKPRSIDLCEI